MSDRPTVASVLARAEAAHAKIDSHEEVCAERYSRINEVLGELKDGAKSQNKLLWGVLIAVAGWALSTLAQGVLSAVGAG